MTSATESAAAPGRGVIQGREACREALRAALAGLAAVAPAAGPVPREAWMIDRHFAEWPLEHDSVLDGLSAWLRPAGRRLHLIGHDFDTTARALPRFARWRRDWSHRIDVVRPADGQARVPVRGLFTGAGAWQWLDAPDWRLRELDSAVQVRLVQEQIADFLQRCEPAWPVTTLGL
jgi:hypothetical protein